MGEDSPVEANQANQVTWDILGFGAVAVDDLIYLDAFPLPDSKTRVRDRERHGGGLCATALVAAAKLGSKCAFAAVLGRDELSRFSLHELEAAGVDVSQVLVSDEARPQHSTILVEAEHGTRTILSSNGGVTPFPAEQVSPQVLAQVLGQVLARARVVFVDHTVAGGSEVAMAARMARVPIVADVERMSPGVQSWIAHVDHLIVGEKMAHEMSGRDQVLEAARVLGSERALAVVTRGERGSVACGRETALQVLEVPAFAVEAVDTTGCGDVFHGAYASELARGSDVATRLKIASAVAAIKAQHRGGRGGLPTRNQALKLVERG